MAKNRPTKIVSKKHLARLERERRQTRFIVAGAIGVLAIVILSIGYGILDQTVLQLRQPIVRVNKDVLTTRDFQIRVKVAREQLIDQYNQYTSLASMFGIDINSDQSMQDYLSQISSQLDDTTGMGNQVIESFKSDMIIQQYAKAHGIVISSQEIDKAEHDAFGYFPNGTLTPTPSTTPFSTSTLSLTQIALAPPTETSTATATGTPTITPSVSPTPTLPSTSTPIATAGPSATPAPTATPLTLAGFQSQFKTSFTNYMKLGATTDDIRLIIFEENLYKTKVEDVIEANFPHTQEQVWARHILVADQATAEKVYYLLITGGDWNAIAKQYSTDTATQNSGGDLGWFPKGQMVAEFEAAAFSQPIGQISHPLQASDGWHIIQVLGHENRVLTADQYSTARDNDFQSWINTQLAAAKVTVYDYWTLRVPTSPTLAEANASDAATQAAMQTQGALVPTP